MSKKEISNKPQPPKKPLAPFFLYKQDVYEQVKKEHPESKITELTKIVAEKWKKVDDQEKKRYQQMHEESKKKYVKEKTDYEEKYGKPEKKIKRKNKNKDGTSKKKAAKKQKKSAEEE